MIISADTDFGTLLTLGKLTAPSFVLLRGEVERHPETQASALIRELPGIEQDLQDGAIAVITGDRIRIRRLRKPSE